VTYSQDCHPSGRLPKNVKKNSWILSCSCAAPDSGWLGQSCPKATSAVPTARRTNDNPPYLNYFRADLSTMPNSYDSFVVPQQRLQRSLYDIAQSQQADFRKVESDIKQVGRRRRPLPEWAPVFRISHIIIHFRNTEVTSFHSVEVTSANRDIRQDYSRIRPLKKPSGGAFSFSRSQVSRLVEMVRSRNSLSGRCLCCDAHRSCVAEWHIPRPSARPACRSTRYETATKPKVV